MVSNNMVNYKYIYNVILYNFMLIQKPLKLYIHAGAIAISVEAGKC